MRRLYFFLFAFYVISTDSSTATSIKIIGVDVETNDAWRSSDIPKPFIDEDNIYGTDGYFIAQYPNGNENNTLQPSYADIQLVLGKGYEGVGAEQYQAKFDDVAKTGDGDVADLVCGDYWANSGPTGTLDDFFEITLKEAITFRLGVITDTTPDGPPGLLWESSRSIKITGPDNIESDLVDAVGPNEEWKNADVDYVLFEIAGDEGDVFTVWGENDERWKANALGGIFFDPPVSSFFGINEITQDKDSGSVTIEFTSSKGTVYGIEASSDLVTWDELDDGVIGEEKMTLYVDDVMGPENKGILFYRIKKLD